MSSCTDAFFLTYPKMALLPPDRGTNFLIWKQIKAGRREFPFPRTGDYLLLLNFIIILLQHSGVPTIHNGNISIQKKIGFLFNVPVNNFSVILGWSQRFLCIYQYFGQCLLSPWTLSSLSELPGLCPEYPWTLSRLATDSMKMSRESMDIVQGAHRFSGHFTDG